jgi:2-methylcitrate dehydratase PrpD
MPRSLTASLADFVAGVKFDELPPAVVGQAKNVVLDAVGCAIAAFKEDPRKAHIAVRLAQQFGATPQATVIGGPRSHPAVAALANGILINAADNDDTHKRALAHLGSVVVPAALAATEARGGAGRDVIEALVAGYEVAARVGMAVMPTHYRFWHSTATNGTFGSAAAAAKAWALDADGVRTALGFAGTQAAGLNTFFESGDDSKSVHPGKAGMNGVLAAMLAELGATSPPDVLGHPKGYLAAYSLDPRPDAVTSELGVRWEILQNGFKFYPSILASHSPIGAALEIVARHRIPSDRIRSVEVRTYATVKSHFSSKDVQTTMAARLSVPYCVAAALVDGEITQKQFTPERFGDPRVLALLERVEIVVDPELSPLYPDKFPARVVVTLHDSARHEATWLYPKGDPSNPLSPVELVAKFRQNVAGVVSGPEADELLALISSLETAGAGQLAKGLAFGDRRRA